MITLNAIQQVIDRFGHCWLDDWKYRVSRRLFSRKDWETPIRDALAKRGIPMPDTTDPSLLIDALAGFCFYKPDPFWGLVDYLKPPIETLFQGGDCDDFALLHAEVWEAFLPAEWEVGFVSWLSQPFWWSHHFAYARHRETGRICITQPQPTREQYRAGLCHTVFGYWDSLEEAVQALAKSYPKIKRLVYYDVRDTHFNKRSDTWLPD